jgi:hypothetical protein
MANEATIKATLSFASSGSGFSEEMSEQIDVAGTPFIHNRQIIGFAAEEALLLGDAVPGGFFLVVNRDPLNFVQLIAATGETPFVQLKASEFALFRIDPGATAPFAQADTANCEIEYWLLPD